MTYIMFSKWFGLISVILSLGILFNPEDAKAMAKRMVETETGYIMGGVLPVIFGTLAFMQHSSFKPGWQIVVTLVGLFMLLIGVFRVIFVRQWKHLMRRHLDKVPALFSLFGLIAGLLMIYIGYFEPILQLKTGY
ncbi:hypothetical protein [Candidiatus Paracoxiella cheracis]|uniref:hypothetical protein n=1 Tax=Candidiatus Paracoxiella cheracis TaxID=3405120 RepID=UPI003BF5B19C